MEYREVFTSEPTTDGWAITTSEAGGFHVALPIGVAGFTTTAPTTDGAEVSMHNLGGTTAEGISLLAMTSIRSDSKPVPVDAIEKIVESFHRKGTLISRRALTHAGLIGIEAEIQQTRLHGVMRLFAQDSSLYMLMVEYPPDTQEVALSAAARFFESFGIEKR